MASGVPRRPPAPHAFFASLPPPSIDFVLTSNAGWFYLRSGLHDANDFDIGEQIYERTSDLTSRRRKFLRASSCFAHSACTLAINRFRYRRIDLRIRFYGTAAKSFFLFVLAAPYHRADFGIDE